MNNNTSSVSDQSEDSLKIQRTSKTVNDPAGKTVSNASLAVNEKKLAFGEFRMASKNSMATAAQEKTDDSSSKPLAFGEFRKGSENAMAVAVQQKSFENLSGTFEFEEKTVMEKIKNEGGMKKKLTKDDSTTSNKRVNQPVARPLAFGIQRSDPENSMVTSVRRTSDTISSRPFGSQKFSNNQRTPRALGEFGRTPQYSSTSMENEVDKLKKQLAKASDEIRDLKSLVQTTKADAVQAEEDYVKKVINLRNHHDHEIKRKTEEIDQLDRANQRLLELVKKLYNEDVQQLLEKKNNAEQKLEIQMEQADQFAKSMKSQLERQIEQHTPQTFEAEKIRDLMKSHEQFLRRDQNATRQGNQNHPESNEEISRLVYERENIILKEMTTGEKEFVQRLLDKVEDFENCLLKNKRKMRKEVYRSACKVKYAEMAKEIRSKLEILILLFPNSSEIKDLLEKIKNFNPKSHLDFVKREYQEMMLDPLYVPVQLEEPIGEKFLQCYNSWINTREFKNYQRKREEEQCQQSSQYPSSSENRNGQPGNSQGRY